MRVKLDKKKAEELLFGTEYCDLVSDAEKGMITVLDVDLMIEHIAEELERERKNKLYDFKGLK